MQDGTHKRLLFTRFWRFTLGSLPVFFAIVNLMTLLTSLGTSLWVNGSTFLSFHRPKGTGLWWVTLVPGSITEKRPLCDLKPREQNYWRVYTFLALLGCVKALKIIIFCLSLSSVNHLFVLLVGLARRPGHRAPIKDYFIHNIIC